MSDSKLPIHRHSLPTHSNITEPISIPLAFKPNAKKFKESNIQGPQGYTGKHAGNRTGTMTRAYAGHQGRV